MPLDYPNERYVRLYRPTPDHKALCWQARVIWPLLLQEATGAGLILTSKGAVGVAAAIDVPVDVVEAGLEDLMADKSVVAVSQGYLLRNYVEAQTATMTDTARKARQREREVSQQVLSGVTRSHAESRGVTHGHDASRSVTPSRAEPNSDLSRRAVTARKKTARELDLSWQPNDKHAALASEYGLNLEVEATRFRNHAESIGRVAIRWDAAFNNWLSKAVEMRTSNRMRGSTAALDLVREEERRACALQDGTCKAADCPEHGWSRGRP